MSRITWSHQVGGLPRCNNPASVPRRPVIWFGEVWLKMPGVNMSTRSWRSKQKITRHEAQEVMAIMLADLIEECGENAAIDSGFRLECR